jgi:DNA-binding MarR family transcriptional regulator
VVAESGGLTAAELELCMQVRTMCACNRIRRSARAGTQLYDAGVAASGLKVTQTPILVALASAGDLPLTVLADALGLDRTTLTRNLKVLEQRGLVCLVEHEDDARVRIASITPAGTAKLAGALKRWEDVQRSVEARFGRERLQALYAELDALGVAVGA